MFTIAMSAACKFGCIETTQSLIAERK